jgi:hypothetical protein
MPRRIDDLVRFYERRADQEPSLEPMEKACRDFALRHGCIVDQVFVDAGESAKTTNRPEFLPPDALPRAARQGPR